MKGIQLSAALIDRGGPIAALLMELFEVLPERCHDQIEVIGREPFGRAMFKHCLETGRVEALRERAENELRRIGFTAQSSGSIDTTAYWSIASRFPTSWRWSRSGCWPGASAGPRRKRRSSGDRF